MIAVGLDGLAYLEEEDEFKVLIYSLVARRAIEVRSEWQEDLSTRIANKIGKAMNG